jgi:hypothetical protein
MAATYTLGSLGTTFSLNKCLLGIYNASGSAKIARVYRVWALNNSVTAVTGVLTNLELRRLTSMSGGTSVTPMKHDTTSASFPAQITVATGPTVSTSDLFRRVVWSNDEPAANAAVTMDEIETIVPLSTLWDVGYNDSTIEPIVLREGYGLGLVNTGNTSVGVIDVFFEVTLSDS